MVTYNDVKLQSCFQKKANGICLLVSKKWELHSGRIGVEYFHLEEGEPTRRFVTYGDRGQTFMSDKWRQL